MNTRTEQPRETDGTSYGPMYLLSRVRRLLPPEETLLAFERHVIRSQVELLKGVRTIVESYVTRLEECESEKKARPQRVSKIEIEEES